MSSPDTTTAPEAADAAPEKKFASREDWLGAAGKLAEVEHYIEGIGWLVLSEITGEARAEIVGASATALNEGRLDIKNYQKALLQHGVVDPASPAGDRKPFFRAGDLDRVMRVGGKKITAIVEEIEKLSAMGRFQELAEGNSAPTPNGASTS